MKKVVLLSGGIDSTTCLALALQDTSPEDVLALNIYYGQKHDKEMASARNVAAFYGVRIMELNLQEIFSLSDCSLLYHSSQEIDHRPYADQVKDTGGKKPVATYVPFRNGLMLSAAASIAMSVGASEIYYGAHADDAAGCAYPDCSIPFVAAIDKAIREGTGDQLRVVAPFVCVNKTAVVAKGLELKAPYHLTWSCYEGKDKPCGQCGTCIDRAKAFRENGVEDPYGK